MDRWKLSLPLRSTLEVPRVSSPFAIHAPLYTRSETRPGGFIVAAALFVTHAHRLQP